MLIYGFLLIFLLFICWWSYWTHLDISYENKSWNHSSLIQFFRVC